MTTPPAENLPCIRPRTNTMEFDCEDPNKCPRSVLITTFVISLIALTIAVLATIASNGGMSSTSAFFELGHLGAAGSAILLTLTSITSLFLAIILFKSYRETYQRIAAGISPPFTDRLKEEMPKTSNLPKPSSDAPTTPTGNAAPRDTNEMSVHLFDDGRQKVTKFFLAWTKIENSEDNPP